MNDPEIQSDLPPRRGYDEEAAALRKSESMNAEEVAAKRDPFVTLRIVVIIFVPLIVILIVTGLDTKLFSLFSSPEENAPKSKSAPVPSKSEALKSELEKTETYRMPRSNTPPP